MFIHCTHRNIYKHTHIHTYIHNAVVEVYRTVEGSYTVRYTGGSMREHGKGILKNVRISFVESKVRVIRYFGS